MRAAFAEGHLSFPADLWFAPCKPAEELFDCDADPHCLHNLAGDLVYRDELQRHAAALDEHLATVGDWGKLPEQDMVDRGLVKDQIAHYTAALGELASQYTVQRPS
jgi:hypothetical protein